MGEFFYEYTIEFDMRSHPKGGVVGYQKNMQTGRCRELRRFKSWEHSDLNYQSDPF